MDFPKGEPYFDAYCIHCKQGTSFHIPIHGGILTYEGRGNYDFRWDAYYNECVCPDCGSHDLNGIPDDEAEHFVLCREDF